MSAPADAGRVVVIGDVMWDVSVRPDAPFAPGSDTPATIEVRGGGGGANTAAWLARLGAPAVLIGCVGDDDAGREATRTLEDAGVDARLAVAPGPTGSVVVIVAGDGERSMLTDPGANALLSRSDVPPNAFEGGRLHVSGYTLLRPSTRTAALAALAMAREAGMSTSVDLASWAPLAEVGADAFLPLCELADLLIATVEEAEVLTGVRDPERAARRLLWGRDEVVLKLGPEGALWRGAGGAEESVPAADPGGPPVDSTGAGDAFAASWIASRRAGEEPAAALWAACALAAEVVTRPGARPPA